MRRNRTFTLNDSFPVWMVTQPMVMTAVGAAVSRMSGPLRKRAMPMPISAAAATKAQGVASNVIQSKRSKPHPNQATPKAIAIHDLLRFCQPLQAAAATSARQGSSQPLPACQERVKSRSSSYRMWSNQVFTQPEAR